MYLYVVYLTTLTSRIPNLQTTGLVPNSELERTRKEMVVAFQVKPTPQKYCGTEEDHLKVTV